MPSGNVTINREIAKEVQDGIVYQVLPEIEHERQMHPLFRWFPLSYVPSHPDSHIAIISWISVEDIM